MDKRPIIAPKNETSTEPPLRRSLDSMKKQGLGFIVAIALMAASVGGMIWCTYQYQMMNQKLHHAQTTIRGLMLSVGELQALDKTPSPSKEDFSRLTAMLDVAIATLQDQGLKINEMERALKELQKEAAQKGEPNREPTTINIVTETDSHEHTLPEQGAHPETHPIQTSTPLRPSEPLQEEVIVKADDPLERGNKKGLESHQEILPFDQLMILFKKALPEALKANPNEGSTLLEKISRQVLSIRKTGEKAAPNTIDYFLYHAENALNHHDARSALHHLKSLPQPMQASFADLMKALASVISRQQRGEKSNPLNTQVAP